MSSFSRRDALSAVASAGALCLTSKVAHAQPAKGRIMTLSLVRRWGCWYQSIDVDAIAESALDLIVVDQSIDGRPITSEVLQKLQRKPDGSRRLVFGYLSVGEAESTRPYWNPEWRDQPPRWRGAENPNWPGSFSVRYWTLQWENILFGHNDAQLDRILALGLDGVFLDRVDAYGDWPDRQEAQVDMIDLVRKI